MLPVVLALEQSEGFFGTQLRHAGEVPNSETVENLCAGQFTFARTERAFDGFRGWRSHTPSPRCQSRGRVGTIGGVDRAVPCMPRRSFTGAERRLPDEGFGHLPGAAVAHRDGCDIAKLMHSDRPVF